ncbi:MAG: TIGR02921 family PEP-CTERM protein, partial [Myxococcales bacterium]|nr:TIGR02921 family PEP-CTERM protein [Myxococcales bacterium]
AAAFAATEAPVPGAEAQAAWRQQAARTRAGLVNAYLQRFRYLDSTRHGGDVRSLYTHARYVDLGEAVAERAEAAFMAWARPFYFQDDDGRFTPVEAAARFRAYFDEDIQVGAAPEVRRATAMAFLGFRTGPAAPADAEARRVHLDRQQITVHPGRGYADVELHEVLRNTEPEDLEVVYAFELPPTAALTGLWLGASEDRSQAFPYVVAPRGAARVVYEQEVRRRVDPALLEQVGPRQFRLRVYPVPGQVDREVPAPALHVWLRYQTLPGPDGWPTPRRLSSRNVFWDGDTIFSPARDDEAWWPEVLPFDAPTPQVTLHVPVDDALALRFSPAGERPALPAGRRFLVVVDRSYSMSLVQDELHSSLDEL